MVGRAVVNHPYLFVHIDRLMREVQGLGTGLGTGQGSGLGSGLGTGQGTGLGLGQGTGENKGQGLVQGSGLVLGQEMKHPSMSLSLPSSMSSSSSSSMSLRGPVVVLGPPVVVVASVAPSVPVPVPSRGEIIERYADYCEKFEQRRLGGGTGGSGGGGGGGGSESTVHRPKSGQKQVIRFPTSVSDWTHPLNRPPINTPYLPSTFDQLPLYPLSHNTITSSPSLLHITVTITSPLTTLSLSSPSLPPYLISSSSPPISYISPSSPPTSLSSQETQAMLAPAFNLFTGEESCEAFRRSMKKMAAKGVTSASTILRYAAKDLPEQVSVTWDKVMRLRTQLLL